MLFGRELIEVQRYDGSTGYEPSYRTIEVADVAGAFLHAYTGRVTRIVASGGYPNLVRRMEKPHDGSSEGLFMAMRLRDEWNVTNSVFVEPNSGNTFANLAESINNRLLRLGEYCEEDPLVISCNEAHAARVVMLTRYVLNLETDTRTDAKDNRLYLLRPYPEQDPAVHERERMLAKLTKVAITLADRHHFPPGTVGCSEHLLSRFGEVWDDQERVLQAFDATYGLDWQPEEQAQTEVIDYYTG